MNEQSISTLLGARVSNLLKGEIENNRKDNIGFFSVVEVSIPSRTDRTGHLLGGR